MCNLTGYVSSQGVVFKDVCVDIATKRILWSVSGHARPGTVLAILGPSGKPSSLYTMTTLYRALLLGSGKTTLLNTLAGQVKKTSGSVSMNGHRLTKKSRRKMCYVLQADIFFPNLTLRETIRVSPCLLYSVTAWCVLVYCVLCMGTVVWIECVFAVFCSVTIASGVHTQRETKQSGGDHQDTSSGGMC